MVYKGKKVEEKVIELQPSNFENIDMAFFEWMSEGIRPSCTTNKGWQQIPIIWTGQERVYQIKKSKTLRDKRGTLIFPLVAIEPISTKKDPEKKGVYWGNIPPESDYKKGSIVLTRRIKADKTAQFRNEQSLREKPHKINFVTKKPMKERAILYETIEIPMPVYVEIVYKVTLKAQYKQQINELLQPFITKSGGINHIRFGRNGHMYEAFLPDDFGNANNTGEMAQEERVFKQEFEVRVLAYVFGDGDNQETPKVVIRENIVEVKLPKEHIIVQ